MVLSDLNNKIEKARAKRVKESEARFESERNREIMENVLKNLGKKDSEKVLLELYETTLHKADHINDSPSDNMRGDMISINDLTQDSYSKKT